MKTYKFPTQNESMYEVSSKSDNGKVVKYTGKIIWGDFHRGGEGNLKGEFKKKLKTYKFPSKNESMYEVSSKSDNGKVIKYTGKLFWGEISQGGGRNLGGEFKKKMKIYKFPSENEYMYEVSSKSDNGKVCKCRGKIFGGRIS